MVIGDPYKFGFLIERVPDWEYPPFVNGLMFFYLNEQAYPKELRTTTLSTELPELLAEDSPLVKPKEDKKLFYADSDERFERLYTLTYPEDIEKGNDLSYLVPFHEINDSGYAVFTLTDGESVMITVGKWSSEKLLPVDEKTVPLGSYQKVIDKLLQFYQTLPIDEKQAYKPKLQSKKPAEKPKNTSKAKLKRINKGR